MPPFAAVQGLTPAGEPAHQRRDGDDAFRDSSRAGTACDTRNGAVRLVAMMSSNLLGESTNGARCGCRRCSPRMSMVPWCLPRSGAPRGANGVVLHDVER